MDGNLSRKIMDSIILKGRDYDNLQEIDSRSQSQTHRVVLYRVTKGFQDVSDGDMILVEEEDAENSEYLLDADEAQTALDSPAAFMEDAAAAWADRKR